MDLSLCVVLVLTGKDHLIDVAGQTNQVADLAGICHHMVSSFLLWYNRSILHPKGYVNLHRYLLPDRGPQPNQLTKSKSRPPAGVGLLATVDNNDTVTPNF